jgi:hypothetical protein
VTCEDSDLQTTQRGLQLTAAETALVCGPPVTEAIALPEAVALPPAGICTAMQELRPLVSVARPRRNQ